jgi:hypothetical protein
MSEYLSFNKSGQWSLHKATNIANDGSPKDANKPGNKPYKVYRGAAMTGDLHEDNGMRGTLHDFNGGARPKNQTNWKNAGKPHKDLDSVYDEHHPGEAT